LVTTDNTNSLLDKRTEDKPEMQQTTAVETTHNATTTNNSNNVEYIEWGKQSLTLKLIYN
jgi:hypothetical protein